MPPLGLSGVRIVAFAAPRSVGSEALADELPIGPLTPLTGVLVVAGIRDGDRTALRLAGAPVAR